MERLPIKFFSKREEDNMRVEGGGGNRLPSFVLTDEKLAERTEKLSVEFDSFVNDIQWKEDNVPVVMLAKLNPDALAKSHRGKINTLFSGEGKNNVIGLCDERTLKIKINSSATASEIRERLSQPQKYAYEISCIEAISEFRPKIVRSSDFDDYKVKLINFQDYSLNKALEGRFELFLKKKQIDYKKTRYSSELEIFKLIHMDSLMLDSLLSSEIFDLTEEIVPMPKVFFEFDSLDVGDDFPIIYPNDNESYAIVGVLDNGIEKNRYLTPWIAGKNSPYPNNVITPSHGTKVASIITYGDLLEGKELVGNKHVKVFDATVFPDTKKESFDEDDLIANIQEIRALTIEEQESFLEYAKKTRMSKQFRLLLNTGLRTGELIGLTWDNFDRKNRMLTVDKSLEYRHEWKAWRAGPPKTLSGFRKIPLTEEAYDILMELYKGRKDRKEDESLSQVLKFVDSRSGIEREVCLRDLIFINWRTGKPMKNSTYDNDIYKICDKAGIKPFCMHVLRHTFATRCIERGVSPKSLQKILGHAQLSTTMDTYVHVTDESLELAMKTFEAAV